MIPCSIYIPRSHSAIHPHIEASAVRPRSWMRSIHVEYHLPGSLTTNSLEPLVTRLEAVWVLRFRFNALSQTVESHDTLLNNLLIRVMYILKWDGYTGIIIMDYQGKVEDFRRHVWGLLSDYGMTHKPSKVTQGREWRQEWCDGDFEHEKVRDPFFCRHVWGLYPMKARELRKPARPIITSSVVRRKHRQERMRSSILTSTSKDF